MVQIGYSPIGDLITIIITYILMTQLTAGHVRKNAGYLFFLQMIIFTFISALTNVIYYSVLNLYGEDMPVVFYLLNVIHHICLFIVQILNVIYLTRLVALKGSALRRIQIVSYGSLLFFSALELYSDFLSGLLPGALTLDSGLIFMLSFILFTGVIFWVLITNRSRMVQLVFTRLIMTWLFCMLVLWIQGRHGQSSFTDAVYLLPILQLIHFLHPTPFDAESGAFDEAAFNSMISSAYKKHDKLIMACLHLYNYEQIGTFSDEMRFELYHFFSDVIRRGELFRTQQGRLILVFREKLNPDYPEKLEQLRKSFQRLYDQFHADFRVVFLESTDTLSKGNDYLRLVRFLETKAPLNSYITMTEQDINDYMRHKYIVAQLQDIATGQDLNDPRILVYCQPVYNVSTRTYDTAEALMRLKLPETGMIFPDQFISLAESYGFIHPMSLIILNKTCQTIKHLMEEKRLIKRISVNFSIEQLRLDSFCNDVIRVIRENDIPFDKIAIELTESQNETDFEMVRDKIRQLKEYGITFYLDDFGTGYSNMERIMELPFDIIKFDRSMVIESAQDKNSEFMVNTFADMFRKLDYDVLYEGVEDENDELRCIRMLAVYLQGYKYSRPIDIAKLIDFLSPDAEASA